MTTSPERTWLDVLDEAERRATNQYPEPFDLGHLGHLLTALRRLNDVPEDVRILVGYRAANEITRLHHRLLALGATDIEEDYRLTYSLTKEDLWPPAKS